METSSSFLDRHQFLIYRLFSLCGLVPIGAYLCVHLLTNATILDSPATFQTQVDRIHSLGIILPLVEWVFIFIPIGFHAVIGWIIISGGMPNTGSYPYVGNIRYTLQRATGIIAFFFIIWHVIHLHNLLGAPFKQWGGAQFEAEHASSSAGQAIQAALWIKICYAVGVLACVYHFANGLFTQGMTWGIWTSPAARRRANFICTGIGIVLAFVGLSALTGMSKVNVEQARQIEDRHEQYLKLERGEQAMGPEATDSPKLGDAK